MAREGRQRKAVYDLPATAESIEQLLALRRAGEIPDSSWRRHTRRLCQAANLPMVVLQRHVPLEEQKQHRKDYIRKHIKEYRRRPEKKSIMDGINKRQYARRRADPNLYLGVRLRVHLNKALRRNQLGVRIEDHALSLLGCSLEQFKHHLEGKFQPGMSWENYGAWHIDHERPLSSFDLTIAEQRAVAFHFSNMQPLWAADNIRKKDHWSGEAHVNA